MRAGAFATFRAIPTRSGPRSWLPRLAAWVAGATRWRRALLALTLGAMAVLALPPVYIVPALIPAFTGLLCDEPNDCDGIMCQNGSSTLPRRLDGGLILLGAWLQWCSWHVR